jgi:FkbM family methyltransferase
MKSILRKMSGSAADGSGQPDPYLELKKLTRNIGEPIIFDVGAHRGYITSKFRSLIPDATVHAFEPFPESFQRLAERNADDRKVHCHPFGLAERDTEVELHANESAATNSILATDDAASETWGSGLLDTRSTVRIRVRPLDRVADELGLSGIDILKLDVQGAEPLVMDGAAELCRAGKIRMIYTEIITQPTYKGQKRFDEALGVFYDRGFDLHNLYNLNSGDSGQLRQLDAIFVKAD